MAEHSELILEARELGREYPTPGEPLVILKDVGLELARGESLSIMGESGSGKSTLLHILGTLDRPSSGELRIEGTNPLVLSPADLAAFRNSRIGFVFQDHHLLPQCSVLENVLIPTYVGGHDAGSMRTRAEALLERVGLAGRLHHLPSEISGGERQRVAIARALINGPALLFCDEPTGNLDPKTTASIGNLFTEILSEGDTSMVVVTHSPDFADRFKRKMILSDGKLAEPVSAG